MCVCKKSNKNTHCVPESAPLQLSVYWERWERCTWRKTEEIIKKKEAVSAELLLPPHLTLLHPSTTAPALWSPGGLWWSGATGCLRSALPSSSPPPPNFLPIPWSADIRGGCAILPKSFGQKSMATSALANKGETTAERFPTCSHRKSGSRWNGSTQPFQKSWEMSIKTGFDHVMETPYQIKKKEIKSGTQTELQQHPKNLLKCIFPWYLRTLTLL